MHHLPHCALAAQSRRCFLAAAAGMLTAGCAVNPLLNSGVTAARIMVLGFPGAPISKETVARLPYASIGAKIGEGQQALLVLGRYDGVDRHWISADRAAMVTRNGRVIRLFGTSAELRDTVGIESDPIAAATFDFERVRTRFVDLGPVRRFGVLIESTFKILRRENISILGQPHDTLVVRERNDARSLRWSFDNEYWLDFQSGYVWRSIQHFSPDSDPIAIEVFKRDA